MAFHARLVLYLLVIAILAWGTSASRSRKAEKQRLGDGDVSQRKSREEEITYIPGLEDDIPSRHYGGYITVDESTGRHLYYYFATSQNSPSRDPVILWLNGGPGCSSFDGFVYEHGPFSFKLKHKGEPKEKLELELNPHAWSKVANVIYLDSPAGVGMSYSETKSDYVTNDTRVAADTNNFLRLFFDKYPEFLENDFYIFGESYAGIYVPTLARDVVRGNEAEQKPILNLKGYGVGNGCTDDIVDGNAILPFAVGKALLSKDLYARVEDACGGQFWNVTDGSECAKLQDEAYDDLFGINIYNILGTCYHGEKAARQEGVLTAKRASRGRWPLGGQVGSGRVQTWTGLMGDLGYIPPCEDSREMWAFCNSEKVRKAIHAEPISVAGRFDECSARLDYTHDAGSMIPIHAELVSKGLRALIYSGDHDMCVPHTGSETWTQGMGLPLVHEFQPWFIDDRQVAGFSTVYENLTYITIRGAGHMVPQFKPREALEFLTRFLGGERI